MTSSSTHYGTCGSRWETIRKINKEAVASMRQGRNKEAVQLFVKAFGSLEAELDDTSAQPTFHHQWEQQPISSSPEASTMFSKESIPVKANVTAHVCCQAFLLPTEKSNPKDTAATLLFNAALAYHLEALEKCDSQSLRTALLIYHQSYELMQHSRLRSSCRIFLLAAICNNIGQVCCEIFEPQEADSWYGILRHLVQWPGFSTAVSISDLTFFHLSVFFFDHHSLAMAPAA